MNFKKITLPFVLGASLGTAYAATSEQGDGIVEINGEITSQTCIVSNATNGVITVNLPHISLNSLDTSGKVAGTTPFTITLKGCPAASDKSTAPQIGIYFSGMGIMGTNGTLINVASTSEETGPAAANVNVQLVDSNKKPIDLNNNVDLQSTFVDSDSSLTFQYYAQYYATGEATVGVVKAQAPFVIAYK